MSSILVVLDRNIGDIIQNRWPKMKRVEKLNVTETTDTQRYVEKHSGKNKMYLFI